VRANDGAGHQARGHATLATLFAGAVAAVVVFLPAEGRVLAPLHDNVERLLGQASFLLPLGLVFVGLVLATRLVRPSVALPTRRLTGLALLALAVLPAERLLGYPTGVLGDWVTGFLLDVLGAPLAVTLTLVVVVGGAILALAIKLPRRMRAAS
jgi:hypothetical protein